jgi:glycosyltransferase involved in cell wall biosynthesis
MITRAKPVIFDVTRLIRRGHFASPTGIDRIERKYIEFLLKQTNRDLEFQAWLPFAGWCKLPRDLVESLTAQSTRRWTTGGARETIFSTLKKIPVASFTSRPARISPAIRLTVAHNRPAALRDWHRAAKAHGDKICYFVHDLIPVERTEFGRPRHKAINHARIAGAVKLPDMLIVNSHSTRLSIERFVGTKSDAPPIMVAPFGLTLAFSDDLASNHPRQISQPYFLCIGTIEPRKNHMMLLQIWRHLARSLPKQNMPMLVIAGRRGWENKEIIASIEQCKIDGIPVTELNNLSDGEMIAMIRSACAVLMPSFAEGFGLPVTEALGAHCPVIASDIAAHREAGGSAPLFLSATDTDAWQKAILDFASPGSKVRCAYYQSAKDWRPFEWSTHFAAVTDMMERL